MKRFSSLTIIALVLGTIVASCVPHDEYGRRVDKKKTKQSAQITEVKEQEINAKREQMRLRDEQRRQQLALRTTGTVSAGAATSGEAKSATASMKPTRPPVAPKRKKNHPVAAAVPGKPGLVYSPFNNKVVDVSNIAPGTLVADPQYPPADKKYFRVP